jgi:hypothetical protein
MVEGKQQKVLTKKQLQFETYEQGHVTAIEVQKSHAVVEYRMHLEFLSERSSSQHHKPLLASSSFYTLCQRLNRDQIAVYLNVEMCVK